MYVELEDVKSFLRVQTGVHDPEVDRAVLAAHRDVDRYCGWQVADGFAQGEADASARVFAATNTLTLRLDTGFWTATDLVVKTDDDDDGTFETTWAASEFELHPANNTWGGVTGFPYFEVWSTGARSWPVGGNRANRVQITAIWGWQECPPDVAEATLLRTAQLFARRDTRDGVQPLTGFRAGGRDRDWELLLDDYRHPDKLVAFA